MNIKEEIIKRDNSTKRLKAYVEIIGTRVNNRFDNNTKIEKNEVKKEKVVLIKDVLSKEVNQLGMHLYVMMQNPKRKKDAIRAWDNLENIINKPITDKVALEKIINILTNIGNEHPEIVEIDNKRMMKLLKK